MAACCLADLNRDEAHGLAGHRFTDGLRVRRIRFAALHERFDISWWDEPHLMTESCDLARPIVGGTACFHPYQAGWQLLKETQNFATPQLSVEHRRALSIRAMNLENVLGQIQTDGANVLHGTVPPLWRSNNDHVLAF